MDDFEVDGTIYRREGPFDDMLREERRKAFLSVASPPPHKPRKRKPPTLVSVAKQADAAGIPVARYEVEPDGKINVVTGKPEESAPTNDFDKWKAKHNAN
jgi:hypothetical protein